MKREQVGISYSVNVRLQQVLERLLLVIPLFTLSYAAAILYGYIPGSPLFSPSVLAWYGLASMLLALLQLTAAKNTSYRQGLFLLLHHLLLAAGLLFIFGVASPVVLGWGLLLITTLTFFGRVGVLVSFLTLLMLMLTSLLFLESADITGSINYLMRAGFLFALLLVFSTLRASEFNEQGKVAAAEERHSKQREALLTIINGTSQAIFTISSSGKIRIYNAALLNLLDTNESLSGKSVDDVLVLQTLDGEPTSIKALMKTSPRFERDDVVLKFADGDHIRLQLSVNPIQTAFSATHKASGGGYVCIARDVTKEKSLDDERDEFISVVSHELRTPVAITEGTLSNLQFFLEKGTDPSKLIQSVKAAHDQIMLLSNMINDLGTLSRAERGAGDSSEEIDLRELAETMYKNYQESATKKGLTFNIDAGARLGKITTSRLYLEEALQNFITNAIKYTDKGSVTLRINRRGSDVEFAIVDTGIGISKSDIKHIFEKFYRSEDYRTRETSGTGLGLYVVAKLMHKLGATTDVSSRLNHGSTFSFLISDKPQNPKT